MARNLAVLAATLLLALVGSSSVAALTASSKGETSQGWAPAYDHEATRKIVKLQLASDCHQATIANWTCKPCLLTPGVVNVSSFVNKTHGMNGYVAYDSVHRRIVVAFRGTHDLQGWLADFDFKLISSPWGDCNDNATATPVPLPTFAGTAQPKVPGSSKASGYQGPKHHSRCLIERGFYQAYQDLQVEVRTAVAQLATLYPSTSVVVTGHSLGASVATNCAMDLIHWLPTTGSKSQVDHLVTIGSPRVGNPPFAMWATKLLQRKNITSVRLVHNSDLVPKLPTQSMGYLHIGNEVWYPYGHGGQTSNRTASAFLLKAERDLYKVCKNQYRPPTAASGGLATYLGEDPQCSDSVIFQHGIPDDHMEVMGMALGHEQCFRG